MAQWHPRPPPPTWIPINPRPLLPIYPPPEPLSSPALPSPPRQSSLKAPYILTTHVVPAAFIRSTPDLPIPPSPPEGITKAERRNILLQMRQKLAVVREDVVVTKPGEGFQKVLWNCVNRYVRKDSKGTGVTLFFAHANGFPKEIWEPTLQHLLLSSASQIIDEVWTWEAVQHGDSALLNATNLGGTFDWTDNARDVLNFLLYYLPQTAAASPLPAPLARLPAAEIERRKVHGFSDRTFIAVGHSFGGCTSALAALTYSKLFSSLILVDPVIVRPMYYEEARDPYVSDLALGALQRRETWKSKEEALQMFSQSPFFGAWDPAVLKIYVECGLYSDKNGTVSLKMPGIQEAVVFLGTRTSYEVWQRLEDIDERIALRWVVPGKPGTDGIGGPEETQVRVWRRPNNSSNIRILSAGHLIPQEAPLELAHDIGDFLHKQYTDMKAKL